MAKKKEPDLRNEIVGSFNKTAMLTKDAAVNHINYNIESFEKKAQYSSEHTPHYYRRIIELLKKFCAEVERAVLPDDTPLLTKLDQGWHYTVEFLETGLSLYLSHMCGGELSGKGVLRSVDIDARYELVTVKTKLLTISEFAEMSGTSAGAVRQWIRRGKITSAVKAGKEWRIPEFARVRGRVYEPVRYEWEEELTDLANDYAFLKGRRSVWISQDAPNRTQYSIGLSKREGDPAGAKTRVIKMDAKEKEKFELFLIGHPKVKTRPQEIRAFE